MAASSLVVTESDHTRFIQSLQKIRLEANARFAFLLDKAGQQIASFGEMGDICPTSLASLTAGNVAATEGVAQLVGEEEFPTLFHEGKHDSLYITVIANRIILLVVFDERSSLGLVRLRVDQQVPELTEIVTELLSRDDKSGPGAGPGIFDEISDDDIDALFG